MTPYAGSPLATAVNALVYALDGDGPPPHIQRLAADLRRAHNTAIVDEARTAPTYPPIPHALPPPPPVPPPRPVVDDDCDLLKGARAAYHALLSYANGNAATDLAVNVAGDLERAIANAEGRG